MNTIQIISMNQLKQTNNKKENNNKKEVEEVELIELNKDYTNEYVFNYLKGKWFITSNAQLYNALIYNIYKDTSNNKVVVYIIKHCVKYKHTFNSIMQLFEYFYNKGYHLEL